MNYDEIIEKTLCNNINKKPINIGKSLLLQYRVILNQVDEFFILYISHFVLVKVLNLD